MEVASIALLSVVSTHPSSSPYSLNLVSRYLRTQSGTISSSFQCGRGVRFRLCSRACQTLFGAICELLCVAGSLNEWKVQFCTIYFPFCDSTSISKRHQVCDRVRFIRSFRGRNFQYVVIDDVIYFHISSVPSLRSRNSQRDICWPLLIKPVLNGARRLVIVEIERLCEFFTHSRGVSHRFQG